MSEYNDPSIPAEAAVPSQQKARRVKKRVAKKLLKQRRRPPILAAMCVPVEIRFFDSANRRIRSIRAGQDINAHVLIANSDAPDCPGKSINITYRFQFHSPPPIPTPPPPSDPVRLFIPGNVLTTFVVEPDPDDPLNTHLTKATRFKVVIQTTAVPFDTDLNIAANDPAYPDPPKIATIIVNP